MTYIADDIVCDAPAGRMEGAAAYHSRFIFDRAPFHAVQAAARQAAT
jgi:hypothetical protein